MPVRELLRPLHSLAVRVAAGREELVALVLHSSPLRLLLVLQRAFVALDKRCLPGHGNQFAHLDDEDIPSHSDSLRSRRYVQLRCSRGRQKQQRRQPRAKLAIRECVKLREHALAEARVQCDAANTQPHPC